MFYIQFDGTEFIYYVSFSCIGGGGGGGSGLRSGRVYHPPDEHSDQIEYVQKAFASLSPRKRHQLKGKKVPITHNMSISTFLHRSSINFTAYKLHINTILRWEAHPNK